METAKVETVLVVDDDDQMRSLVRRVLEGAGFSVLEAKNGMEALSLSSGILFDLVILDVNMPDMNGREVCWTLRSAARNSFLPIVLISGNDTSDELVKGLAAGANDFVGKPFKKEVLLAKVKALLATRAIFGTNSGGNPIVKKRSHEEVAVAFVDLRGFTAFSEAFDLIEVTAVLDEYYREIGLESLSWDGKIGGLAGDGVLVFFNRPYHERSCMESALRFSLGIRVRLAKLIRCWNEKRYRLDFGIGIAQGVGQVGNVGFDQHQDYTVIGSVSNKAARLASQAKGNQILVSLKSVGNLNCLVRREPVGALSLKGFKEPIEVCNILALDRAVKDVANLR